MLRSVCSQSLTRKERLKVKVTLQSIVDKEGGVESEGKAIGDDSYDVEKGFVDNTLWRKGVGQVGGGVCG